MSSISAPRPVHPDVRVGSPGKPVSPDHLVRDFSVLYSEHRPDSAARAVADVQSLAAGYGIGANNVKAGPAMLESLPPKGYVTGELSGAPLAVDAALRAIEDLDLGA